MKKRINLAKTIRSIPDFPKPGILFRDITTLVKDKAAFAETLNLLSRKYSGKKIDYIAAVEARGFIFGGAMAIKLNTGFIPVRKKGKLPWKTKSITYNLEYGTDTLEIHEDALKPNDKVLIVDDLLATGGTAKAVADLIEAQGAKVVGIASCIELVDLKGREKLKKYPVVSLVKFEGE